ncbi:hypothetical protein TRSC58_01920 [Trypanosoma rangeli SC58]|uniref:Actin-like protein n=1 Tax=Trypanosoma rangeli SC58 TaxID=429131 RepID=A0A061J7M3_TRYRA|nr:hypothetical protein TRSC58_01920 [Trypanosoma rangeli SC58]
MQSAIVLDAGSSSVKAACSNATAPNSFPSLAGRAKYKPLFHTSHEDAEVAVGNTAAERRGLLHLSYPIQHGSIVDWNAWHLLLQHIEQQLSTPLGREGCFLGRAPVQFSPATSACSAGSL